MHSEDFRPHVCIVFGHQKRRFSKPVPRVEFLEKAGLNFFCVWKDEKRGFRIRRCQTSYSPCHKRDAIETTQKIISLFQNIQIRVDEACVVSYYYGHTTMRKVIHEPIKSHDSRWFLVQSLLENYGLWEYGQWKWHGTIFCLSLASDFPRNFVWNGRLKHSTFLKKTNKQ